MRLAAVKWSGLPYSLESVAMRIATIPVALFCAGLVGCAQQVQVGRIGAPVALTSGKPRSACERANWQELAPARVVAKGMTQGISHTTHYSQINEGMGVFRLGSDNPEDLEEVLPKMGEPELAQQHMEPIERVNAANRRAVTWALVGLGGMAAGLIPAALLEKDNPGAAAAFGISGVAVGVMAVVGTLINQPSGEEQLIANARRRLFIPQEDDMRAVERGLSRMNTQERDSCDLGHTPRAAPAGQPRAVQVAARSRRAPAEGAEKGRPVPASVFIAGGVTVVMAAGAGVTGALYQAKKDDFDRINVDPNTTQEQREQARADAKEMSTINLLLTGGAIAGASVTAILFFTRPEQEMHNARLMPWVYSDSAGLVVTGGF